MTWRFLTFLEYPRSKQPLYISYTKQFSNLFSAAMTKLIRATDNFMYLNIGDLKASRTETKTM
jgi:hypothetical protein